MGFMLFAKIGRGDVPATEFDVYLAAFSVASVVVSGWRRRS
jgi:hypothetical protein